MNRFTTLIVLLSLAGAQPAIAQIPQTVSYQGVLTDGAGNVVADGSYNLTFQIFNVATGGTPLWTEVQPAVPVSRGGFSVLLGSVTPFNLPFNGQYWLGIAVNGGGELTPRVQLASSPYSLNAQSLALPFTGSASVATPGAVLATTNTGTGRALSGTTSSTTAAAFAIYGQISSTAPGVTSAGVRGESNGTGSAGYGVYGSHAGGGGGVYGFAPSGIGVFGQSISGNGIYGTSATGAAGFFQGNVTVTGTLTKTAGAFKIDHPLDPENRYLYHSFVESPDMKNIYDGNVVLDSRGEAWVALPAWFEALNRDFRYQLTAIGAPGPRLYIAEKITRCRFKIAGGAPGMEVSWQVTGIRHDAVANAHRIPVEQAKPAAERGLYLDPQAFGQPAQKGIVGAPWMAEGGPAETVRPRRK